MREKICSSFTISSSRFKIYSSINAFISFFFQISSINNYHQNALNFESEHEERTWSSRGTVQLVQMKRYTIRCKAKARPYPAVYFRSAKITVAGRREKKRGDTRTRKSRDLFG